MARNTSSIKPPANTSGKHPPPSVVRPFETKIVICPHRIAYKNKQACGNISSSHRSSRTTIPQHTRIDLLVLHCIYRMEGMACFISLLLTLPHLTLPYPTLVSPPRFFFSSSGSFLVCFALVEGMVGGGRKGRRKKGGKCNKLNKNTRRDWRDGWMALEWKGGQ